MMSSTFLRTVVAAGVFAVAVSGASAQGLKAGSVDVAVGGGYAYLNTSDAGTSDGKKNHGILDASVSYDFTKRVSLGFEYTFTPLDNETISGVQLTERLHNYGAVARFALLPNRLVVPYAVVAGGGLSLDDKASQGSVSESVNQSGGYFGIGGGANLYLHHGFGVRPEFRYQREQLSNTTFQGVVVQGSGKNEIYATASLFYQFGGRGK